MCCKILIATFAEKRRYKHPAVPFLIFAGLILVEYSLSYLLYSFLFMKIFAGIMAITIAMFMLFNAGWFKLLVLTILYQGIGIVCDYSVILLLGRMFPILHIEQMETFGISCLITIVSRIVLLFIVLIIRRKMGKNTEDMLTEFEWLELLIIPTITILSIITIILKFNVLKQSVQDDVLLYIALGMAVMNIVVFFCLVYN
jgi:hypothetical protein